MDLQQCPKIFCNFVQKGLAKNTQQELAALCNFPGPWNISRLEGGKKGSGIERIDTLEVVCQELGIELWELLKPDWDVAGEEDEK